MFIKTPSKYLTKIKTLLALHVGTCIIVHGMILNSKLFEEVIETIPYSASTSSLAEMILKMNIE